MEIIINDRTVLYDEQDHELITSKKWRIVMGWGKAEYASSSKGSMHRLIMRCPKGLLVDHKNHNTLDNRRENLRICNRSENMWNRKSTCGISKYKGVVWYKNANKWSAGIWQYDKRTYLGLFETEVEAAIAYNKKAAELFGEFACLNIIPTLPKEKK